MIPRVYSFQAESTPPASDTGIDVHITSSKACQAFSKRATKLRDDVKKAIPSAKVEIDEKPKEGSKPDKGSFVVMVKGAAMVELRGMVRPFTKMKDLDMDEIATQVIKALK